MGKLKEDANQKNWYLVPEEDTNPAYCLARTWISLKLSSDFFGFSSFLKLLKMPTTTTKLRQNNGMTAANARMQNGYCYHFLDSTRNRTDKWMEKIFNDSLGRFYKQTLHSSISFPCCLVLWKHKFFNGKQLFHYTVKSQDFAACNKPGFTIKEVEDSVSIYTFVLKYILTWALLWS